MTEKCGGCGPAPLLMGRMPPSRPGRRASVARPRAGGSCRRMGRNLRPRYGRTWREFDVSRLAARPNTKKTIWDTRWVLTWEAIAGSTTATDRLVGRRFHGADLQQGLAETAGRVILRSPLLRLLPLRAAENGESGDRRRLPPGGLLPS